MNFLYNVVHIIFNITSCIFQMTQTVQHDQKWNVTTHMTFHVQRHPTARAKVAGTRSVVRTREDIRSVPPDDRAVAPTSEPGTVAQGTPIARCVQQTRTVLSQPNAVWIPGVKNTVNLTLFWVADTQGKKFKGQGQIKLHGDFVLLQSPVFCL